MTKLGFLSLFLIAAPFSTDWAQAQDSTATPVTAVAVPFDELQRLIRQHLADATDEELNAAAVNGLIAQLKPHVMLGQPAAANANTNPPVARAERYRNDFGYLRVSAVTEELPRALRESIDRLLESGPLKGLVIDLRSADGTNYAAAARAAGLFTATAGTLLRVGDAEYPGDAEGDDILIPVMTLTNGETSGAAEALAAVLRNVKAGLILGGRTSGQAMLYENFPLSNGQTVRIASQPVQLGDGTAIPRTGLTPDLPIATTAEEDRRYLADPYWEADPSTGLRTATPRRRITEADLVRQRREGISLQQIITNTTSSADGAAPVLRDPALVRALDMLKALTVVQSWKKEKEQ